MRDQADNKGVAKFLGTNLAYLLRLTQVADHEYLLSAWKSPADAPKRQYLTALQSNFDDMERRLGVCAPIVVTPGLLKTTLSLSFRLNPRYDLGTGLHQFCPGQHKLATRNIIKAHVYQSQVIVDGGGDPTLVDAADLTPLYGVYLLETFSMVRSAHACLWVVLNIFIGRYDHFNHGMDTLFGGILPVGSGTEAKTPIPVKPMGPDPSIGMDC